MNEEELKKELVGYKSVREKILRLNEIIKCMGIGYGYDYILVQFEIRKTIFFHGNDNDDSGGCLFCGIINYLHQKYISLTFKNCNIIGYFTCNRCKDKSLCTYCLREKENCIFLTKQKITFWLCFPKIPKDIRRLITNYF